MGIDDSPLCRLCETNIETIQHLFVDCPKMIEFWNNINIWLSTRAQINLGILFQTSPESIIFGFDNLGVNSKSLNVLLLVGKHYIFNCARKQKRLNINEFQEKLYNVFHSQECIAKLNFKEDSFYNTWFVIQLLVE